MSEPNIKAEKYSDAAYLKKRKRTVRTVFWSIVFILCWFAFGPDLRFGPDIRFTTKVIDPDKPGFDPQAFQFTDYTTHRDTVYTLAKMFPKGTPRQELDAIMKEQKNLRGSRQGSYDDSSNLTSYAYYFKRPLGYPKWFCIHGGGREDRLITFYDDKDRLDGFYIASCGSFSAGMHPWANSYSKPKYVKKVRKT